MNLNYLNSIYYFLNSMSFNDFKKIIEMKYKYEIYVFLLKVFLKKFGIKKLLDSVSIKNNIESYQILKLKDVKEYIQNNDDALYFLLFLIKNKVKNNYLYSSLFKEFDIDNDNTYKYLKNELILLYNLESNFKVFKLIYNEVYNKISSIKSYKDFFKNKILIYKFLMILSNNKINNDIYESLIKHYVYFFRFVVLYSINRGYNRYFIEKYLNLFEFIKLKDIDNVSEQMKEILDDIKNDKRFNFDFFDIEIEKLIEIYMYKNKDYADTEQFDLYFEDNYKLITYIDQVEDSILLNSFSNFIFDLRIEDVVNISKLIATRKDFKYKEELLEELCDDDLYDSEQKIKLEYRYVFFILLSNIKFEFNIKNKFHLRILDNIFEIYEKINFFNLDNVNLFEYLFRDFNINDLFYNYVIKYRLIDVFLKSKFLNELSLDSLVVYIKDYIKTNKIDVVYQNEIKNIQYSWIKTILLNENLDSKKLYNLYGKIIDNNVKYYILLNKNIDIVFLVSKMNTENIWYVLNNKNILNIFKK